MLVRLTHAAIAFAVTAVLYQAYVLAVAPFVEPPPIASAGPGASTAGGTSQDGDAGHAYRELLAAYFPADHWCLARSPKTLENESRQVLAIFDGDEQSPNGVLTLPRCAVLFFPRPHDRAAGAPRNAIILESSGGAVLQMEAEGTHSTGFGRLQYGQLVGEVVVRSDMNEPGPQDDLRLITHDIYINEDLIRTPQTVDLQLGEHRAFGRELELRWLKGEGAAATPMGLYGAFDDLVIKHDVSLILAPGRLRFGGAETPGGQDALAASGSAPSADDAAGSDPAPPIRIKSAGPFRIDFGGYKATFTDDVRAWQLQADGTMDELAARELTLFFTKTTAWNAATATSAAAHAGEASGTSFEPASIEAQGDPGAPVVLNAPSYQTTARGERLWIELAHRRVSSVVLGGSDEVSLAHRGSEVSLGRCAIRCRRPIRSSTSGRWSRAGAGG